MERTKRYNLIAVITIAVLAVLSGADGFVAIATYEYAKQECLESFLGSSAGIPYHDTFARVFSALDLAEFDASFQSWVGTLTEHLGIKVIQIDGKTASGSYDRESGLKTLHTVSAWSSEHQMVLRQ